MFIRTILGICYGSQLMAYKLGGEVATAPVSEYGKTDVEVDTSSLLFEGVSATTTTWMSHTDYIAKAPQGFKITGHAAQAIVLLRLWKMQKRSYMRYSSIRK